MAQYCVEVAKVTKETSNVLIQAGSPEWALDAAFEAAENGLLNLLETEETSTEYQCGINQYTAKENLEFDAEQFSSEGIPCMPSIGPSLTLPHGNSRAENALYCYAGYIGLPEKYHGRKNTLIYIRHKCEAELGYTERLREPLGTRTMEMKNIDFSSAIMFNIDKGTATIGPGCEMDLELMGIVTARAKELGFIRKDRPGARAHGQT